MSKPDAPQLLSSDGAGRGATRLALVLPGQDAGNVYELRVSGGGEVRYIDTDGSQFEAAALRPNTEYTLSGRVRNDQGESDWSDPLLTWTRPSDAVGSVSGAPVLGTEMAMIAWQTYSPGSAQTPALRLAISQQTADGWKVVESATALSGSRHVFAGRSELRLRLSVFSQVAALSNGVNEATNAMAVSLPLLDARGAEGLDDRGPARCGAIEQLRMLRLMNGRV